MKKWVTGRMNLEPKCYNACTMLSNEITAQLVEKIEEFLKVKIIKVQRPKQGMDSEVFLLGDQNNNNYAIKFSKDASNDVLAYKLILENGIDILVPELFGHFTFENKTVLILEKINFPLLELTPVKNYGKYIPSMIVNLQKLHTITSNNVGLISGNHNTKTWKELLLFKYSGKHPWFNWNETINRTGVDKELLQKSISEIKNKIEKQNFIINSYSFLHTDFNQRNLFVNQESNQIAAIIDWSEAMFGDPLYDFARVRMFIWHFNLQNDVLEKYYSLLSLSQEEMKREELYLVSQILDYITWYSQVRNNFNDERLKRHQKFLEDYKW